MKKFLKVFTVFTVLLSIAGCSCSKPSDITNLLTTADTTTSNTTTTSDSTTENTTTDTNVEDK